MWNDSIIVVKVYGGVAVFQLLLETVSLAMGMFVIRLPGTDGSGVKFLPAALLQALESSCPGCLKAAGLQGLLGNTDSIHNFSELFLPPMRCSIYAASADRSLCGRWYCLCYFP